MNKFWKKWIKAEHLERDNLIKPLISNISAVSVSKSKLSVLLNSYFEDLLEVATEEEELSIYNPKVWVKKSILKDTKKMSKKEIKKWLEKLIMGDLVGRDRLTEYDSIMDKLTTKEMFGMWNYFDNQLRLRDETQKEQIIALWNIIKEK